MNSEKIKIHVLHTGHVYVSKSLPFGENASILKITGIFSSSEDNIWLPVSSYLIEHPKGKILFDCGWHRDISPNGEFDKWANIKTLGFSLYLTNQGLLKKGEAVNEQLETMNIKDTDLEYVIISHLDCDHVHGLKLVQNAKNILVAPEDLELANSYNPINMCRYQKRWWDGTKIKALVWNGTNGPFKKSYDLFGDGSIELINIPGHSEGLVAMKVKNINNGKFVLLFSDGGYATRSWKEMIIPGIVQDLEKVKVSLNWIKEQSMDENCVESLANHDPDIKPHVIEL